MGHSRTVRNTIIHALACLLFIGGYWFERSREQRRQWHVDLQLANPANPERPISETDSTPAGSGIRFEDIALESGIDFSFYDGAQGNLYISETTGGWSRDLGF